MAEHWRQTVPTMPSPCPTPPHPPPSPPKKKNPQKNRWLSHLPLLQFELKIFKKCFCFSLDFALYIQCRCACFCRSTDSEGTMRTLQISTVPYQGAKRASNWTSYGIHSWTCLKTSHASNMTIYWHSVRGKMISLSLILQSFIISSVSEKKLVTLPDKCSNNLHTSLTQQYAYQPNFLA